MAPTKNDNWVRRFMVTNPQRHKSGFTVYKVTSVVYPRSAPEAATQVTVWKRYNDFKKLYNSLRFYHKHFKIKDELPKLSKAKFFNRFEEDVINERIECALELLNFVGQHQPLFTCDAFQKFFNNGYSEVDTNDRENNHQFLENGNCEEITNDLNQSENASVIINGTTQKDRGLKLGGTWSSRLCTETISVNSKSSDEESTFASDTGDSVSPVLSIASPSCTRETGLLSDNINQNILETAVDVVEDPASKMRDRMAQSVCSSSSSEVSGSVMTKSTSYLPDHFGTIGETVTCHSEKPVQPSEMWLSVRTQDFNSSHTVLGPETDTWLTPPGTPSGKQDYLVEAAYHVGQAQNYEASCEYEAAFSFYKAAIACLLSGVNDDDDKERRQAVRGKTARYLQRAERIYALHLASEKEKSTRKRIPPSIEDLKSYKVLEVIDKVMLVLDTQEDKCYVIKVLEKSPSPIDSKKKTIIPHGVPYMVQLFKYYENDSSVYLILQYASGGRLWDHIDRYLQSIPSTPIKTVNETEFIEAEPVIKGYQLLNKDEDKPAENQEYSEKSYLELLKDYTTNTAKKIFGYGEGQASFEEVTEEIPDIPYSLTDETETLEIEVNLDSREVAEVACVKALEDVNSLDINCLEVDDLVENCQKLLESVNKTLSKSEVVTSHLNKELKTMEGAFQLNPHDTNLKIPNEGKISKKRSTSARPRFERRFSSEDMLESRSRTASSSLDRGGQWSRLAEMMEAPRRRLSEPIIRKWAAELLVALETLHRWGIICRDLHPNNILLGEHGHLLLTYQIHWKGVDSLLSEEAVSGLFTAPETTKVFPITSAADWWSYGALLYFLLTGKSLSSCYPSGIYSHTILTFPDFVSPEARSLVTELLRYEPSERLGGGINGSDDIKSHSFFCSIDWQLIYEC